MSDWVPSENNPNDLSLTTMEEMLSDVLQEQAFMFSENRGDGEIAPPDPPYHYARIEFDGPCSGRLGLIFPQSLVSELIANMLGMEVEDIEKEDSCSTSSAVNFSSPPSVPGLSSICPFPLLPKST